MTTPKPPIPEKPFSEWCPLDFILLRLRPWHIRVIVLAGFAMIVVLSRLPGDHRRKSPCPVYARLCDMTFTGRIKDLHYGYGRLNEITIQQAGKRRRIREVDPYVLIDFELGDSIRKMPGSLEASISDAYGRWHQIQLFEMPDTNGCTPIWPIKAFDQPLPKSINEAPKPILPLYD